MNKILYQQQVILCDNKTSVKTTMPKLVRENIVYYIIFLMLLYLVYLYICYSSNIS